MRQLTLLVLTVVFAAVLAEGQFYVPRAYYTIDAAGHESAPIPLRRLRRSILPSYYPQPAGANANANARADARANASGSATANANAVANADSNGGAGAGPYAPTPIGASLGSGNPAFLKNAN